jgi:5'-deoxynucleotidase YfbR-like HD superfamily hydrolase
MKLMIQNRPDIDWFYDKEQLRRRTYEELVDSRNVNFEEKFNSQPFGKDILPPNYLSQFKKYLEDQKNSQDETEENDEVDLTDEDILNYVQGGKVTTDLTQEQYEAMYDIRG